jgi:histidine triad (HIT) family protein
MNQDKSCPFCDRIAHGIYDRHSLSTVSFEPLNPVIPGHLLIVPRMHVADATVSLGITAETAAFAALLAAELGKPCNLITSVGTAATQTVRHLHFHLVPRRIGDGLTLPWTGREVTGA